MSPAPTKNDYGVMIGKKSRKKEEKEETLPRAELEASMQKRGELNESEPQEARKCKDSDWGK